MDAVLGLSVTPSAVGLVLVEGQDGEGATLDRDAFEQTAAAVRRTEAIAASHGRRLHTIGVTWSDDADAEASRLLRSLTDCGFDNVVPVRLPEATEALAWGIAGVIGHDVTAVCVVEPETVTALILHTQAGAVQTAINRAIDSDEALLRWLSAVFARADWQPEALVVVGTAGALDGLMPRLEDALAVPVYAPAEAELALARGAALASAHNTDLIFADNALPAARHRRSRRPRGQAGPLAMLAVGAVTFVVSVSVAVGAQFIPKRDTAGMSPEAAAAVNPLPADVAPPAAPPPQVPPTPAAHLPVEVPAEPPLNMVAPAPEAPVDPTPPVAPVPPAPGAPLGTPPPDTGIPPAPGLIPAQPTPVPQERPGILRRIKDRLDRIGQNDEVQQAPAPVPPPGMAPPADHPLPPPAPAPPILPPP